MRGCPVVVVHGATGRRAETAGTDRFDFNVALQSFSKRQGAPASAGGHGGGGSGSGENKPTAPARDYSLKEGQTFSIKIPGREGRRAGGASGGGGTGGGDLVGMAGGAAAGGIPMLAPPPPSSRKR